jgi:hypothetical protein
MIESRSSLEIFNMVILLLITTVLIIILVGVYAWARGQRGKKALDDVDWEKEKERLLFLAAEKKASRKPSKKENEPKGGGGDKSQRE